MTASAGVAAASGERLATAVHGDTDQVQAAIVIVSRDTATREILTRELSKRYGGDYQIVVCDKPAELSARMRGLRAAGLPAALVVGGVGAADPDDIEVLAAVRAIDPAALRVAAVGWGDWHSVRPVFGAVTLGTLDHWVISPAQAPAEEFHRSITEFLREWGTDRGGGFEPVHVIGRRWSARSQELRDLFARYRVPAGFMTPPPAPVGRCCTTWAWSRRNCRWSCFGSPRSGRPWSIPPTRRSSTPSAS
jgi:thioredoxin reductase (NADPH)